MNSTDGYALANYLNRCSTRYSAGVMDFRTGCWVLITDKETVNYRGLPAVLEPIADFSQYLARARYDRNRIPPDLLDLLETWNLAQRSNPPSTKTDVRADAPRPPQVGAIVGGG